MSEEFERAANRISKAISEFASGGEAAFKNLAKVILEELARAALARMLPQPAPVWEERPPRAPAITPAAGASGAVSVHFHLGAGADANSISRHQGQIAAAVARAVAYGRRNL
jgi:hypothetical protein